MALNTLQTKKETTKKTKKPYEPLEFETLTLSEDVILASTFDTKGTYDGDGDWIIFDGKYL